MFSSPIALFKSFRNQLFMLFSLGVVAFALVAGVSIVIMTTSQVKSLLLDEGYQVVGSLANQSVLALLYGSGENAENAVDTALAFPAVDFVAVLDADGAILLERGSRKALLGGIVEQDLEGVEQASIARETEAAWYFTAPVVLPANDFEALNNQEMSADTLGYVVLRMDKNALHEMQFAMMFNHLAVGATVILLLLGLLHISMKRMFRPLEHLVQAMQQAREGQHETVAIPAKPIEVCRIADVYNQMIGALSERDKALRRSNELLESQVAIRTQELEHARDAALEANRHKSEFIANMSHELRTPLQSILGYSDVIREELENSGLDDLVEDSMRIENNASHLLGMINEILDLAKVEAGRHNLNPEEVDLRAIVSRACDTVMPIMNGNGNRLDMDVRAYDGPVVLDRSKVFQVILNLLSNAAKFTENGRVRIEAGVSHGRLRIAVKDTGIGIEPSQHEMIFDPFRQADGSVTRRFQGTGLGLAITREFVRLMGGEIVLNSAPGEGAEFIVTLPVNAARVSDTG